MKRIDLKEAIKLVHEVGKAFSGSPTVTIKEVDLIAKLCATIIYQLMHGLSVREE